MRFVFGKIPENSGFNPDEGGWKLLKEPPFWIMLWVIPLPVGILTSVTLYMTVTTFTPFNTHNNIFPLYAFFLIFIVLIIIHELIHAVISPDRGLSDKTIIGFWPSKLVFYAHYEGAKSRNNFLLTLIAPFLVLSVLPILLAAFFELSWLEIGYISILNGFASSMDIFNFFYVLFGIKKNHTVQNKGWYTYWKVAGVD